MGVIILMALKSMRDYLQRCQRLESSKGIMSHPRDVIVGQINTPQSTMICKRFRGQVGNVVLL